MLAVRILVAPGARTMMSNSSAQYLTRPLISLPFQNGTISPLAPANKRYSTDPVKNKNVVLDPAESAWSRFLFRRFKSTTYDSDITVEFKEEYLDCLPNDQTFQIPRNFFDQLQGKYSQLKEQNEALSLKYEVLMKELNKKEIELKFTQQQLDKIVIPLTVREYANNIKNRFPSIKSDAETKGKKQFEKWLCEETSIWLQIFKNHADDCYVELILKEFTRVFKQNNQIDVIEGCWIEKFENEKKYLAESIVKAINFANKLIAHRESEQLPFREALNLYDNIVDPRITIFYNAIISKKSRVSKKPQK